jgi:hypothetical protein
MHLTPEVLQQFAETAIQKLVDDDPSIVSAYLCGSAVLPGNPLLGGTTDIDIVLIHTREPEQKREFQRLTDDVHLDICHHSQDIYRQGRELRVHPWMGPTLHIARPIHDPRHFLDFTQASVRGLFNQSDYKIQRVRTFLDQARRIWLDLQKFNGEVGPYVVARYLEVVGNAVNAIASLEGDPLTERRLLLDFPKRAEILELPGLAIGVSGLLGAHHIESDELPTWLPSWEETYDAIPEEARPAHLHFARKDYYLRAFDAMINGGEAKALLWPLMNTWTMAAGILSASNPARQGWRDACQKLDLISADYFKRMSALDAFLDRVDEAILGWDQNYGG